MTELKDLPYAIIGRELVANIDGMWVQVPTRVNGDTVHWHMRAVKPFRILVTTTILTFPNTCFLV